MKEKWVQMSTLQSLVSPSDGVESSSEDGRSDVTPRGGHTGHGGPVVCSDVVDLHRVQVWHPIKTSHYVYVVIQQSNTGPWRQKEIIKQIPLSSESNTWGSSSPFLLLVSPTWPLGGHGCNTGPVACVWVVALHWIQNVQSIIPTCRGHIRECLQLWSR